ncbi:hypothetical protein OWP01_14705 [Bacillus paranthracis]|uniref:HORMA-1 domain-containing protein n=1 Tax=Bacillus paranthracis TaxID=2026186 RepID=UPI00254E13B4|nr:hypothetical protein [Bacillus paranthracis]MDK7446662.1 hypothetical protein [Bacillus paranthracis]MDN8630742.1 hypothetical protein [Bacillus paranthracis]MDN8637820.1 hypothetical protein [Bacillus paranthracis]HDR7855452.1 hypothetical protein [Bacillus paranthracis]
MSYSYTRADTRSYTYANVRYINDKIIADLDYLLARFPGLFTDERLKKWKNDFYNWMNDGYARAIKIQFKQEDECFCEIKYELKEDRTFSLDDNVGRLRVNLSGASTSVVIENTQKWHDLSEEQQQTYRGNLELNWGPAAKTNYSSGLDLKIDKQYSSGSLGVQRSILGGAQ